VVLEGGRAGDGGQATGEIRVEAWAKLLSVRFAMSEKLKGLTCVIIEPPDIIPYILIQVLVPVSCQTLAKPLPFLEQADWHPECSPGSLSWLPSSEKASNSVMSQLLSASGAWFGVQSREDAIVSLDRQCLSVN
jgi:hypothetical protein